MKRSFRLIALILVFAVLCLSMTSCAGKFALTHKLLNWNNGLNKWLASFVMFIFIVIPVYGICALIDWVIINAIEFYSGDNPVDPGTALHGKKTAHTTIDGRDAWMTMYKGSGINIDLTTVEADGTTKTMVIRTTDEGMVANVVEGDRTDTIDVRTGADGSVERCYDNACESIDSDQAMENLSGYADMLAALQ